MPTIIPISVRCKKIAASYLWAWPNRDECMPCNSVQETIHTQWVAVFDCTHFLVLLLNVRDDEQQLTAGTGYGALWKSILLRWIWLTIIVNKCNGKSTWMAEPPLKLLLLPTTVSPVSHRSMRIKCWLNQDNIQRWSGKHQPSIIYQQSPNIEWQRPNIELK